jgi:hypothetical protein
MDLEAIFGDPAECPPEPDEQTVVEALKGDWSTWTENRDGVTWTVMQLDGEEVVPWERAAEWQLVAPATSPIR